MTTREEPLWTRRLASIDELDGLVAALETSFTARTIVLLEGDLGSGKTETVKTFARRRGLREVASPSFAVHLRYEGADGVPVDHLDLYRLTDDDDLESTGFWDLFGEPAGIVFIEWADRLAVESLPRTWTRLRLRIEKPPSGTARTFHFSRLS